MEMADLNILNIFKELKERDRKKKKKNYNHDYYTQKKSYSKFMEK